MIDYQADKMLDDYANRIQSQGIGFEDYLRMMGMTMDDMRAQSKTAAARTVRSDLALEAVAAAEGLEISDTAVDEEISRLAEQYKMEEDKVRSIVNADDIRRDLMMRGALDLVKSSVKKTAKKAEKSEEKAEKKTAKKTEKAAKKSEDDDAEESVPKKKAASKAKTAEE